MNPYFATNPNDIKEERQPNSFNVDDESDVYFLQQAYQYHETLIEDENRPVLKCNPIYRDREGAEDRLMCDYFNELDQKMVVTDWNEMYANPSRNMQRTWVERCETHRRKAKELRDRETHISLQHNLMEHIWNEVEHEDEDF
ncbi:hypothetical protein Tco_1448601 [Tanacetum coccineum]